ncbi:hypothetical protein PSECIP111951_00206 [Pseudoalteromonas holothuriae]|uniref:Dystroglycan-type cadherin-like domain-containing protein n=1 Tax=Pseudoalteromonas holothuriae TaxID=2963714 RepID=A0ABN8UG25_9GAMM|nr:putative Ig domain-containing protein [Pseudoalteromonas sp. CIP111951]CAH9050506.1 hypothetical protein PSECIP111951_00206 [Pseudoalteromonas sp. CIP111951]
MSAVISGEGLGLFNSSLSQLGSKGSSSGAALGQASENIFVNAATGNLVLQNQDEQLKGLGLGLGVIRTYNSLGHFDGDNNDQWRLGFLKQIELEGQKNKAGSVVTRTTADGYEQLFTFDTSRGLYVSRQGAGADDTLTFNANGSAIVKPDGATVSEHYNSAGRLTSLIDNNGHKTSIQYSGSRATSIVTTTSNGTEKANLVYNAQGLLEQLSFAQGESKPNTHIYYIYDTNSRLSSVKVDLTPDDNSVSDGKVYETKYTYFGTSNRVEAIRQSDGTSLTVTYEKYGNDYRVKTLKDGEGNLTEYKYLSESHTRVSIANNHIDYFFDQKKRLVSTKRVGDNQVIQQNYSYDNLGRLNSVTDGMGHITDYEYDNNGNITKQTNANGISVNRKYNNANQLIEEQVGDETTHYIYDAKQRLRFIVNAQNAVVEYGYNNLGQRSRQHVYTTAHYTSSNMSLAALEQFVANVERSEQQKSTYSYDFRGQLNLVTRYTTTDEGIVSEVSSTRYVYDAQGLLLQETTARGEKTATKGDYTTTYSYDGLGRVLVKTDANKAQTTFTYDDANQKIATHYANGLWETNIFDKTGALTSSAKGVSIDDTQLGQTRFYRDAQSRLVAKQDEQGARSYVFYDTAGQRAATVSSTGSITEYEYDSAGRLSATIGYAQQVSTSNWINSSEKLTKTFAQLKSDIATRKDNTENRITRTLYTSTGQKEFEIDGEGFVTQYVYNENGKLAEQKQYKAPLGSKAFHTFNSPVVSTDWQVYDSTPAGATMSAEFDEQYGGQVMVLKGSAKSNGYRLRDKTTTNWQSDNRTISWDMKYAEAYTVFISVNTTAGHRYITYYAGDKAPHLSGQYASHYLSTTTTNGQWQSITRDLQADLAAVEPNVTITNINAFLVRGSGKIAEVRLSGLNDELTSAAAQSTKLAYNTAGQLEYKTDGEGYVTRYYYDQAGNEIATRRYFHKGTPGNISESNKDLVTHTFYDGQSRVKANLAADGALTTFNYNADGLKTSQSRYHQQVLNHTVGAPLVLPGSEKTTTHWRYTTTGQVETKTHADGSLTKYRYDEMQNLVHQQTFDSIQAANAQLIYSSDDFNNGVANAFTISNGSSTSIEVVDNQVRFQRLNSEKSEWPSLISKQSFQLKDNVSSTIEVTTSDNLSGMYFYGGLDNSGSWSSKTLDRHAVYFDGNAIYSDVVRNGLASGREKLMSLTTNTTYVINWTTNDDFTTLTVHPKGKPHESSSVKVSSQDWSNAARLRFYNNPRPNANGNEVYIDNLKIHSVNEVSSTRYQYDLLGRQISSLDGNQLLGQNLNTPVNTEHWDVYDPTPSGATMTAVYDQQYNGEVIELKGAGSSNGYRLQNLNKTPWDALEKTISWDMKYSESFTVYISVDTNKGHRYITYKPGSHGSSLGGEYAHIALPLSTSTGSWHTVTRDLLADLQSVEPDNNIKNVNAMLVRGSGRIGQVSLSDLTQTQLANRGLEVGAHSMDSFDALFASKGDHTQYDVLGNIQSHTNKEGAKTLYYYDAKGNERFQIDAMGQVTEYRYNSFNERTLVKRYHTQLSESQISQAGLVGGLHTNKVIGGKTASAYIQALVVNGGAYEEQLSFDQRGMLERHTDAQDYEKTFTYNAFSQLVRESQTTHLSSIDKLKGTSGLKTIHTNFGYDARGLLESTTKVADGITQTIVKDYDAFGRVIKTTDSNNHVKHTTYELDTSQDGIGRVISASQVVDGTQREIVTRYDMLGRMLSVKNGLGQVTRYEYDDNANSVKVFQPNNSFVLTTRNALGKTASLTYFNRSGETVSETQYKYDHSGNLTESIVNGQTQSLKEYDKENRVRQVVDANGQQVETQYDATGRVKATIVDPDGLQLRTEFSYTRHGGQVIKTEQLNTVATGSNITSGTIQTTTTELDSAGRVLSVIARQGNKIQSQMAYQYDSAGNTLKAIKGSGAKAVTTQYVYDELGRLRQEQTGSSKTNYEYDANDNLITKAQYLGSSIINSHNDSTGIQNQKVTYYVYNEANQVTHEFVSTHAQATAQQGIEQEPPINIGPIRPTPPDVVAVASGDINSVTSSTANVTNKVSIYGSVKHYSYNTNGQLIGQAQAVNSLKLINNQTSSSERSLADFLTSQKSTIIARITSHDGEYVTQHTAYDENGQKALHIDAQGGVTQWRYDSQGRVQELLKWGQRVSPLAQNQRQKLTTGILSAAELVKTGPTSADSKVKTIYGSNGQARFTLTLIEDDKASIKESIYDAAGQLIKTLAYVNTVSYSQVIDEATAAGKRVISANDRVTNLYYDNAGRLRFNIDAQGYVTEHRYNEVNNVISTIKYQASINDESTLQAEFAQNKLKYSELATHYSESVITGARISSTEYDALGRVTWQRHSDGTTESYSYNDNGLKSSYTNQNGVTWLYDYDNGGRLAYERGPSQTIYNWSSGNLSDLENVNVTKHFLYDGLGNVTSITEGGQKNNRWISGVQKATTYFSYDNAGRQISMRQNATKNAPATESTTQYDALGRAVSSTKGGITALKVYDNAGNVRFEINGEGNITERRYNALGQEVTLIKYADELTWRPNRSLELSDIVDNNGNIKTGNVPNLNVSASKDRRIETTYDASGRKVQVNIGEQSTRFTYNAFGQEIKKEQLVSGSFNTSGHKALISYQYYNELGQKVATVDSAKYLTKLSYNAFGQVQARTEYAIAATGAFNEHTMPVGTDGNDTYGRNRTIEYHYDSMGRVIYQVQSNVHIDEFTSGMNLQARSHKISAFKYDKLGNTVQSQVRSENTADITNLSAQTSDIQAWEYDAVGRLIHTASAAVATTTLDLSKPLSGAISTRTGRHITSMGYDVFGNLVRLKEHANRGTLNTSTANITAPPSSSHDKLTRHEYNTRGQLIAEYDALSNKTTHNYNALGQLEQTRQSYNEWNHENESYSFTYKLYHFDSYGKYRGSTNEQRGLPHGVSFNESTGKLSGRIFDFNPYDEGEGHSTATITLRANYLSSDNAKIQTRSFDSKNGSKTLTAFSQWRAPHSGSDDEKVRFTKYYYDRNGQTKRKTIGQNAGAGDISINSWQTYYNAFGEVKKDEEGVYVYNQNGQLWKTTKGDGVLKTHGYDKAGRLTSTVHALNGLTEITRDGSGNAILIKQPKFTQKGVTHKPQLEQQYDRWGNIIELKDARGFVTQAQYNHDNKVIKEVLPLTAVTDESGQTTSTTPINLYRYDSKGNLVQKIDGNDNSQTFKFDARGNQIQSQDGENNHTLYKYDIFGRKVLTKDAENKTTTTSYDKVDRVKETGQFGVINNKAGQYRANNVYEYDELGNRTHEYDAVGGVKSYKFDVYGNVVYSRDEMAREKRYVYNSDGTQRHETYSNLHSNSTPNKHKNTRYYDDYGNLQSGNDLGGKGFTYTYGKGWGENNSINTLTNVGGDTTKIDIGRLIRKQNDYGQDLRYTYYENGWLKSISDEATDAYVYFEYDKSGRRTLELRQSWDDLQRVIRHETTTQYDSHGRIALTQTQEYNNTRTSGEPAWQEGKVLSRVTYRYDAVGNRRSMKVENGIVGDLSVDPSYKFYGSLSVAENTKLTEQTGDIALFFQALQIPNLEFSATFLKQDPTNPSKWTEITKPEGISFSRNGRLTGTPSYESAGIYRIDVVATDKTKSPVRTYAGEIQLNIANVDAPIEIKPIPTKSVKEGMQVAIGLSEYFVADSTARKLQYTVTGLPSGLSYNSSTGLISGKLSYSTANTYNVRVQVSDKSNSNIRREQSFNLRVANMSVVTVAEEQRKEISLGTSSPGNQLRIRKISGPSFTQINNANTLIITPSATDGRSGVYIVRYAKFIYEPELRKEFKTGEFEYHILVPDTKVANQPLTAKNGSLSFKEGQSLSSSNGNLKRFFTNPDNDVLSYTATFYQQKLVDISKGRSEPDLVRRWVMVNPPQGVTFNRSGYLQGKIGNSASGTYRVDVTATETNRSNPNRATAQITVAIQNVKPPITAANIPNKSTVEGQSLSYNVSGYFVTDVSSRKLTYSAAGLPSGVSINSSTGVISSAGALKDGTGGNHRITVTASDKSNSSIKVQSVFTLSVENVNYITLNEGQTHRINISSFGGTHSLIRKQLSGAPSWATVSSDKKYLTLNPGATAGRSSAYTFTLTVSEFDPELKRNFTYGTRKYTVLVRDTQTPNRAPTGSIDNKSASEGSYFSHNVTSKFKDPDGDTLTYTAKFYKRVFRPGPIDPRDRFERFDVAPSIDDISNGGTWTYQLVSKPAGLNFSTTGVLSGTPSYSTSGTYKVTVTATEQKSTKLSASREFSLTIANVIPNKAPTVTVSASGSVKKGSSTTVTATGKDTDGSIRQYEWQKSSGLSLSGSGNRVTVKGLTIGGQWVKVRVKDDDGAWSSWVTKSVSVTSATASNRRPVANRNLHSFTFEDRYFSYNIPSNAFTDPDGDTLTYSASGLPSGVRLSGSKISGSINRPGQFTVTITARDPKGLTASTKLYIEVEPGGGFNPREREPFMVNEPMMAARSLSFAPQNEKLTEATPILAKAEVSPQAPQLHQAGIASSNTSSGTSSSDSSEDEYWFTYDGNNRVVHDGGLLINGTITTHDQGQYIDYNKVGQQTLLITANNKSAQQFVYNSWGQVAFVDSFLNKSDIDLYGARATLANTPNHNNWRASSKFEYDAMGRVTDKREYFGANSTVSIYTKGLGGDPGFNTKINYGGAIKHHTQTRYNAAGEVTWTQEKALKLDITNTLKQHVPEFGFSGSSVIYVSEPWTESSLKEQSTTQSYVYDGAGMVKSYAYYQKSNLPSGVSQLIHRFTKEYEARDTYLEKVTTGRGDSSHKDSQNLQDAQTRSNYDVNGNRTRIEEHITDEGFKGDKEVNSRYMRYDAEGKIISKVTGKQSRLLTTADLNTDRSYYNPYTGQRIDWQTTVAKNVGFKEDTSYLGRETGSYYLYSSGHYLGEINKTGTNSIKEQHFSAPDSKNTTVMARHQVQSGDTLKGIAKLYYGNENLWYIIADINGLGAGSDLSQGVILDIPARANAFNTHDNFKPINLGEVIGNTDPSMPYVPPPPEAGCNAVASIVMIAVAVVATIATAGAAAVAMGAASSSMGIMAAGTAALGGSLGAAGVAAAAIGGFAGSVASQLTGKAMGVVDSFSLRNALTSAGTAAVTAGVGSAMGVGAKSAGTFTEIATKGAKASLNVYGRAVMGATASISSVAANKLVGNDASFRWGNVAASALVSGIGVNAGQAGQGSLNPVNGILNSAVRYGADKLFGNSNSWNFGNVATDAFGNAAGNSIVGSIRRSEAETNNRNRYIETMGQKLTADTARKINGQLAINLNKSLNTAMQGVDASVDSMLWAINRNQQIDANAQFAADEARRVSRQQGVVDSANRLSTSLSSQASALENRHLNQMAGIRAGADAAFAKGAARGEAMYAAGVRNREPIGVDLLKGIDVEGNIAWGQQQRSKFNQFYKELNLVQKYAFDKVVSVGEKTRDIVFGPTNAPNAIETEFNLYGNVPIVEGGLGVSLTVDSYGRFSLAPSGTFTITSDVGLNVGVALGQVKGYGTTSSDLGGGEAISTSADVSITELVVDKNSKIGTLLKARPADLFAGYESGYTQQGKVWSQQGSQDQYYFEGGYIGASVGIDGIYKFDTSTVKNLGLDTFIVGKTYEKAWAFESSPNILGRVAYNMLDIFHD